ncbi:DUF1579 domain-containing protein [Rhodopirellula sp. JC740]|uniref:DUF1579 domain-containing protein n=1 Tax=Rhodopirellula halodulae TaxID=2894198 RepID=A0ABS8NI62_9BACT|nr:DUF1579 domain-containing protein [Rhodopirellula sp. JC740]MCC9643250.1 DUF1579 domain-containing protein [Rhodopirellula sp. JC740]
MFSQPQSEHEWLEQLVGEWKFEHECSMPDGSINQAEGNMTCRTLNGMWLLSESSGESEEGAWSSLMSIGFDPKLGHYVGTFIGSMMANIWHYQGCLDESKTRLQLAAEGPKFEGEGTAHYRDTIIVVDENTWRMTSEMQTDEGEWVQFMSGKHTRV